MLKMCLLLLGVLSSVTACGPQYQTVYDYQPPQSKDGLACIRQCSINQTDNNACNLSHRTKKDIKRLHSPSPAQEPEEPTLEEHIELYSEKCSMNHVNSHNLIDEEIRHLIENSGCFEKKYVLFLGENQYNVYLSYPSKNKRKKNEIEDYFEDCIMKIYLWLSIVQPYIRENCSKIMDIFITVFRMEHLIQRVYIQLPQQMQIFVLQQMLTQQLAIVINKVLDLIHLL